ncbi:MAG: TIGR00295 family protein [Candidatus Bathyarchaeota archaeon]|nr:TIGR00295 family protein [Candidatus Bathyarchaeota archaeon]
MKVPTREESLKLLKQAECSQGVIEHCQMVTRIALRLASSLQAKGYRVDIRLIESGAILHDIGRSVTHGVEHGALGGQIARKLGIDDAVARIIERHVGAGLTDEEAQKNRLPPGEYIPRTMEEKIVCYADKLTEGDHEVPIGVEMEKLTAELGSSHSAIKRLKNLHTEITNKLQ